MINWIDWEQYKHVMKQLPTVLLIVATLFAVIISMFMIFGLLLWVMFTW